MAASFKSLSVEELKKLCKRRGLSGYSTKTKAQLIRMLRTKKSKSAARKKSKSRSRRRSKRRSPGRKSRALKGRGKLARYKGNCIQWTTKDACDSHFGCGWKGTYCKGRKGYGYDKLVPL